MRGLEYASRFTEKSNTRARAYLKRATELDPDFAHDYASLGSAHYAEVFMGWNRDPGLWDKAIELGQKAVRIDSTIPIAHSLLAAVYSMKGQHDQAMAEAENSIALDPNNAEAHLAKANVLRYMGKWQESITVFEKAIRLDPRHNGFYLIPYATSLWRSGQYRESITVLLKALPMEPDSTVVYFTLAENYLMAWVTQTIQNPELPQQALTAAQKAVSPGDPTFSDASRITVVKAWLYMRQYEKALAETEQLNAGSPHSAAYYVLLADIFNHVERPDEAIEMTEKALQLRPGGAAWFFNTLGVAYRLSGHLPKAISAHKKVFEHSFSYPYLPPSEAFDANINLAILYVAQGLDEEARIEAEKVLKLSPNFAVEVWGQRNAGKDRARIALDMGALRKAGLN